MYKQTNVEINRNKGKNNRIGIVEAGTFTGRMPNKPTTFQQATMATILVHIHKDSRARIDKAILRYRSKILTATIS